MTIGTKQQKYINQKSFSNAYSDPRWQKLRLRVFERDNYTCQFCGNTSIQQHAHHKWYRDGLLAYQYELKELITLCSICHQKTHDIQEKELKKASQFLKYIFFNPIDFQKLLTCMDDARLLDKEDKLLNGILGAANKLYHHSDKSHDSFLYD